MTPEPYDLQEYDEQKVNIIVGKSLMLSDEVGNDIRYLAGMIEWFTRKLDKCDEEDMLGTEGWRHYFGVEE